MLFLWRDQPCNEPRCPRYIRSPQWRSCSRAHILAEPVCAACGSRSRLVVHHVIPVSLDASLECDRSNLITLCRGYSHGVHCHLYFGHCGRWQNFNPNVRRDAAAFRSSLFMVALP